MLDDATERQRFAKIMSLEALHELVRISYGGNGSCRPTQFDNKARIVDGFLIIDDCAYRSQIHGLITVEVATEHPYALIFVWFYLSDSEPIKEVKEYLKKCNGCLRVLMTDDLECRLAETCESNEEDDEFYVRLVVYGVAPDNLPELLRKFIEIWSKMVRDGLSQNFGLIG